MHDYLCIGALLVISQRASVRFHVHMRIELTLKILQEILDSK